MTLQDFLVLLVLGNLLLTLLILWRLGVVHRELVRLRKKKMYKSVAKKRGRPPKQRSLPL
ncbi:MAG TPA: hypothetical protein VNU93_05265 [Verrucomicrobiae bacterium]|nr:hypothetical protein [Verrucomicrobiae bacterium]